jgi:hypothetical protein
LNTPGERALIAEADGRLVALATFHIFELIYRPRPSAG